MKYYENSPIPAVLKLDIPRGRNRWDIRVEGEEGDRYIFRTGRDIHLPEGFGLRVVEAGHEILGPKVWITLLQPVYEPSAEELRRREDVWRAVKHGGRHGCLTWPCDDMGFAL